jgi:hypothetical protein
LELTNRAAQLTWCHCARFIQLLMLAAVPAWGIAIPTGQFDTAHHHQLAYALPDDSETKPDKTTIDIALDRVVNVSPEVRELLLERCKDSRLTFAGWTGANRLARDGLSS